MSECSITVVPAAKTAAAVPRIKKSFLEALAPESSVKKSNWCCQR